MTNIDTIINDPNISIESKISVLDNAKALLLDQFILDTYYGFATRSNGNAPEGEARDAKFQEGIKMSAKIDNMVKMKKQFLLDEIKVTKEKKPLPIKIEESKDDKAESSFTSHDKARELDIIHVEVAINNAIAKAHDILAAIASTTTFSDDEKHSLQSAALRFGDVANETDKELSKLRS